MPSAPLNPPHRTGYGTFVPPNASPWVPSGTPNYYTQQQPVYQQQPNVYYSTTQQVSYAPSFIQRLSNSFNAFCTGFVVDPITLSVEKIKQIATYPFKGTKEALISAGVLTATVALGTLLGGYGFVLAPLALTGLILGGKDAFKFLKSQFNDSQSTQQKDDSWRNLGHTVGVAVLLMLFGTAIGQAKISGNTFIDFWNKPPGNTKGWEVLPNLPKLTWITIQKTLQGLVGGNKGENYSQFFQNLGEGIKQNATWLGELPKKTWDAIQR
jgi:hypothetical protein